MWRMSTQRQKGGDAWKGKGYMGMISSENVKAIEETSGCMRGGARF